MVVNMDKSLLHINPKRKPSLPYQPRMKQNTVLLPLQESPVLTPTKLIRVRKHFYDTFPQSSVDKFVQQDLTALFGDCLADRPCPTPVTLFVTLQNLKSADQPFSGLSQPEVWLEI